MLWSGLVWAGHVDEPVPADAHGIVADGGHQHVDDGVAVDGCDHCCHAAQHFSGLLRDLSNEYLFVAKSWPIPHLGSADNRRPEPLYKPPKA